MITGKKHPGGGFASTRWSVVLAAGHLADTGSREALAQLFEVYWPPLYGYSRRQGYSQDDTQDLLQGFFTYLLEQDGLRRAEESKGRFRSYLLGAFKHFISFQWRKKRSLKRGGASEILALDLAESEKGYRLEPRDDLTPEHVYERRWALAVLNRSMARLHKEYIAANKGSHFDTLKGHLVGSAERGSTSEAAVALDMSPGAIRVAVYRLRQRFRELVMAEIANTVAKTEDIETEMRHLLAALSR